MYHIGIDVAKGHHDALGLNDAGQIVLPAFRFGNTRPGADQLIARLEALGGEVRLAMESTGHYWIAPYEYLADHGYQVTVFNPLQIRAYRQVGIRKAKTDRIDSYYIADFLRARAREAVIVPACSRRQLRHLARFRFGLIDRRSSLRRRAHMVLDQVFPEYASLFARPFDTTSRTLLRHAVTAEEFLDWPVTELAATMRQASRGRLGSEKAHSIHAAAQSSLGIRSLNQVAKLEMGWLLQQMGLLDQQVATLDETLSALLASEPQYLTTIPGISTVLAAAILGEIGDIHRFPSLKPLIAFAGLDPTVYQSGHSRLRAPPSANAAPRICAAPSGWLLLRLASTTLIWPPSTSASALKVSTTTQLWALSVIGFWYASMSSSKKNAPFKSADQSHFLFNW